MTTSPRAGRLRPNAAARRRRPALAVVWFTGLVLGAGLARAEPSAVPARVGADPAATGRPLWELGLGVAGLQLPDYRGSDQSRRYVLPLPYFVYRGDWFKSDRNGTRALLLDSASVELDLSGALATPTRSRDNRARAGMANLPGVVELGPNLNVSVAGSRSEHWRLDLRLPVRAALSLERSPQFVGSTFSPQLNLDWGRLGGGWNVGLLTGPLWADRRYHGRYYGVAPGDATSSRPAFEAPGGYAGWQALASSSRRIGNTWFGAFVRYDSLRGAAFEASPLLRRPTALSAGFGISWILATSTARVGAED